MGGVMVLTTDFAMGNRWADRRVALLVRRQVGQWAAWKEVKMVSKMALKKVLTLVDEKVEKLVAKKVVRLAER